MCVQHIPSPAANANKKVQHILSKVLFVNYWVTTPDRIYADSSNIILLVQSLYCLHGLVAYNNKQRIQGFYLNHTCMYIFQTSTIV